MSQDTRATLQIFSAVAILLIVIGYALFFGLSHFHDWDCSKHGGLLNADSVYQSEVIRKVMPGNAHAEADVTITMCRDGYRP